MSFLLNISQVNALSDERFEYVFRNVIELYPAAAVEVGKKRPFNNSTELCAAFDNYLEELSTAEKNKVFKFHPDLAGKISQMGELTPESTKEQNSAGLNQLNSEQKSLINHYNESYKEKFGFPFIVCARENKVASILEGLQIRLKNSSFQEYQTALNEVKKICKYRIYDIVAEN
ncbi:2-oxo-4-hydroxy-4-carboxy-5-ureidoimidazoline decarboxylase-like [Bombyx mandarina]|uniref:2-oxo-4-hydroxy-4-carboxy-5-ureidoimidazoline decarboxylase n=1 Tax=Bombyx mandarina TaxID=7092 RepID=A0A6J2KBZ9_BOMMA|nr:2-oxo-4-hydroxy-4-carboxy-5-ureidoimidazoline decarboxylase-like [Bombyx mandarina]